MNWQWTSFVSDKNNWLPWQPRPCPLSAHSRAQMRRNAAGRWPARCRWRQSIPHAAATAVTSSDSSQTITRITEMGFVFSSGKFRLYLSGRAQAAAILGLHGDVMNGSGFAVQETGVLVGVNSHGDVTSFASDGESGGTGVAADGVRYFAECSRIEISGLDLCHECSPKVRVIYRHEDKHCNYRGLFSGMVAS